MLALAGLAQQVDGAAPDDVDAVIDEARDGLDEAQFAGLAVEHGQEDHGEALLHAGVLVELVEDDLGLRAALELDDDAHAVAIGFVAHVADVVDDLVVDQLGDAFDERGLVDLVGDLGDDDRLLLLGEVLDGDAGAHDEAATAGCVGLRNAGAAVDEAAGGEIGTLHVLEDFIERWPWDCSPIDDAGVDDLGEIVRRNVGGHADGDAAGAVDDQVRECAGSTVGLDAGVVEVGGRNRRCPCRCRRAVRSAMRGQAASV